MRALVLSGGALKGAFQAGAIAHVLERGFEPEFIYGISVGALNGGFLADRAGRSRLAGKPVKWPEIGRDLEKFWHDRVKGPEVLIRRRSKVALAYSVVTNDFDGMVGTGPLKKLINDELKLQNIRGAAPLELFVGAVNMHDEAIVFADQTRPNLLDFVYASTAIPISMPMVNIGPDPFYDGGVRDIAPLGTAINKGATDITCITCQPRTIEGGTFKKGNLFTLAGRLMGVITNEIILNDLKFVDRVNKVVRTFGEVSAGAKPPYKEIPCRLVEPETTLKGDIEDFNTKVIDDLIAQGREAARKQFG
jgi:NTE family protein